MKNLRIKLLSIVLLILLSPTAVFADFTVRVVYDDLIIREGPGTNYAVSRKYPGTYTGVGIFTITEVQPGPGATKGWGRLKSGAGWVSMDWVEKTAAGADSNINQSSNSNNKNMSWQERLERRFNTNNTQTEASKNINQSSNSNNKNMSWQERLERRFNTNNTQTEASKNTNQNNNSDSKKMTWSERWKRRNEIPFDTNNTPAEASNINSTKELEEKLKEYEIRLKELQDEVSDLKKKNSENQEKLAEFQSKKDDVLKIIHGLKENVPIKGKE